MAYSDCIKRHESLLEKKVMSAGGVNSSSPNSGGDGDDDKKTNNSSPSTSSYEKYNGKARRRYQRFAADAMKLYSSFGGSHGLLFKKFNQDLMKWPGAIEYVDRPTACFLFCDFALKNKSLPTHFSPFGHRSNLQDYRGLVKFLIKKNLSPAAFECDAVDSDKFFYMYNNHSQRIRPALLSFCAFLKTFQACERLPATAGFFDLEEVFLCFRVGGTLDEQIRMEEEEDNMDYLFRSSDEEM